MKIERTTPSPNLSSLFTEPTSLDSETEFKKLMIAEEIIKLMKSLGLSRKELASRLDVPPSRITSILDGSNNLTIKTLVRIGRALGQDLHQTFAPEGRKVRFSHFDPAQTHKAFVFQAKTHKTRKTTPTDFNLNPTASNDDSRAA